MSLPLSRVCPPQGSALRFALQEVARSRDTLAYTYVEGFFLQERAAKELELFNHLQRSLEEHADLLQVRLGSVWVAVGVEGLL